MYPNIRKISVCTSCGTRTMCVSDDGGIAWRCNRCGVAYGIGREKIYDDMEIQKTKIIAPHPVYGDDAKEQPEVKQTQPAIEKKEEVKTDDQPKPKRPRKKTN